MATTAVNGVPVIQQAPHQELTAVTVRTSFLLMLLFSPSRASMSFLLCLSFAFPSPHVSPSPLILFHFWCSAASWDMTGY